jgi:hypothetical protein
MHTYVLFTVHGVIKLLYEVLAYNAENEDEDLTGSSCLSFHPSEWFTSRVLIYWTSTGFHIILACLVQRNATT